MKNDQSTAAAAADVQAVKAKQASEDYFADFDFSNLKGNLEDLFKSGVHFGHHKSRKNPKMDEYIFTTRKGICIIDLEKTSEKLEEALNFLREVRKSGKPILFVGTKKQVKDIIKSAARRVAMPYVNSRWLGGTFTNFKVIRARAKYLKDTQAAIKRGDYDKYTKYERSKLMEEINKLEEKMGGIKDMTELPGAIVVVDTRENALAVKEANKVGIPIVGIVDSNSDPSLVDYPIPGNDDAVSSVRMILAHVCKALLENEPQAAEKK